MVKHTQTIRQLLPTNCLNVFDDFVGLALKGLALFRETFRFIIGNPEGCQNKNVQPREIGR